MEGTDDTENLREYTKRIENALSKKQPHTTYNRDKFHAFAILMAVFRYAESEVRLLSNKLDLVLYGNPLLLEAIGAFLERKGRLDILVETDIDKDHPLAQMVKDAPSARLRRVPDALQELYKYNFLVMDDRGFRYERDREKHAALAGFHDEHSQKMARTLRSTFDKFSKSADDFWPQPQC